MLRHAPALAGKSTMPAAGGCACSKPMRAPDQAPGPVHHRFAQTPCACQRKAEAQRADSAGGKRS